MRGAGEPGLQAPSAELVATLARLALQGGSKQAVQLTASADEEDMGSQAVQLATAILGSALAQALPALITDELGRLGGAVDANGSIDTDTVRDAAGKLTDALVYLDAGELGTARNQVRRQLELIGGLTVPAGDDERLRALPGARQLLRPGAAALDDDEEAMARTGLSAATHWELKKVQKEFLESTDDDWGVSRYRKLFNIGQSVQKTMRPGDDTLSALRTLRADRRGAALLELASSLRNAGDSSMGQRFAYGGHAYAVLGVDFRDGRGNRVAVSPWNPAKALTQLDTDKTQITLRNPHHENAPDPEATKSRGTGEFTLSLAQFTRHFDTVHEAVVKKT